MSERIRDFRPGEDEAALDNLWERCFGAAAGGQTVSWLFRDGPAGECPRTVVEVDGRVVAHAGVAILRFQLGDEIVRGGYSVGAMTDPEMRGRKLFFRVGSALYERMEREGFAFVAGFSNAQSYRLMTGPLHRTAVRPFPWCIRPLKPFAMALALLGRAGARPPEAEPTGFTRGGIEIAPCALDDPQLDQLWARCASPTALAGVRDSAYARWRFGTRPDAHYRAIVAKRNGEILAWSVYRTLNLRGLRAGFVVDLLVAPGENEAGRVLMGALDELGRREGTELLSALLPGNGTAREVLRRSGYWIVPERLHPQVIRFSVRGLGNWANRPELVDPRAWYLSWADTDVV